MPGRAASSRLLYGFLARDGMRRSEAMRLCWSDIDLERGTVTLDENETDDPRAWMLDPGVVIAFERWLRLARVAPDERTEVLGGGDDSLDEEHLAATSAPCDAHLKAQRHELGARGAGVAIGALDEPICNPFQSSTPPAEPGS